MIVKIASLALVSILLFSLGIINTIPVEGIDYGECVVVPPSWEKIPWTESRKLKWDDFYLNLDSSLAPSPGARTNTYANCKANLEQVSSDVCEYRFTELDIIPIFIKAEISFVVNGFKTDYFLEHEQGHFDIAEISARQIEKEFLGKTFFCPDGIFDIKEIGKSTSLYSNWGKVSDEIQTPYDDETKHSGIVDVQYQWNAKIKCLLMEKETFDACMNKNYEIFKEAQPPTYLPESDYFDYGANWYYTMAYLEVKNGNWIKANSYLDQAFENKPNHLLALNLQAVVYRNLSNYDNAISSYQKILEYYPEYLKALYYLGDIYHQLGQYDNAVFYYDKAIKVAPNDNKILESLISAGGTPEPTPEPISESTPIPTPTPTPTPAPTPTPKLIEDPCSKPSITLWFEGYALAWVEDSPDGGKNAKGIKLGFKDFDGQMSNLQIDCDSKTLTVDLDSPTTQMIVEIYVIENSQKIPHQANLVAKSMSISVDDRDITSQIVKSAGSGYKTEFSFLVLGGTKTLTVSNLSIIPEPLIPKLTTFETFTSDKYGFSTDYPSNWFVNDEIYQEDDWVGIVSFSPNQQGDPFFGVSIISGKERITTLSGNQYLNKLIQEEKQSCESLSIQEDGLSCNDFELISSEFLTEDGDDAYVIAFYYTTLDSTGNTDERIHLETEIPDNYQTWQFIYDSSLDDWELYSDLYAEMIDSMDVFEVKERVPGWIKNNAKWWAEGQIGDSDFTGGIQHLIKEKIIDIPDLPEQASGTAEEKVPDWVKNNAGWWADGMIGEDDFVNGIKWLVENGIIRV